MLIVSLLFPIIIVCMPCCRCVRILYVYIYYMCVFIYVYTIYVYTYIYIYISYVCTHMYIYRADHFAAISDTNCMHALLQVCENIMYVCTCIYLYHICIFIELYVHVLIPSLLFSITIICMRCCMCVQMLSMCV